MRRQRLETMYEEDLEFASDEFDQFIVGVACSKDRYKVVYSWNAAKAGAGASEVYEGLRHLIPGGWLLLHSWSWKTTWQLIESMRLPRWEQLDKAVIGLTGNDNTCIVYSFPLALNEMIRAHASTLEEDLRFSMLGWLEKRVLPVDLGPHTPWFVTPLSL